MEYLTHKVIHLSARHEEPLGEISPIEFVVKYDGVGATLYIKLKDDKVVESDETAPEIIVDYNEKGEIVGIEMLRFSHRRIDLRKLVLEGPESLVAEIQEFITHYML